MKEKDIIIGQKVIPFQKTANGWERDFEEYINSGDDIPESFRKNGYLQVTGYDVYENAWMLGDMTYNDNEDGDYFNTEDFEPYEEIQENKQKLFERFLNASFELKVELMNRLSEDGTYLTDKEQEFTLALSEWHKNI